MNVTNEYNQKESSKRMKKKIIFFKIQSFSHINDNVEKILKVNFSDCDIITVDLWEKIRKNILLFLMNLFAIVAYHGFDILLRRKKINECLFTTPFIFRKLRKIAHEYSSQTDVLFTFQTQSLFDGSYSGGSIKHFLYTDHTFIQNLSYPDFNRTRMPSKTWLQYERDIYNNADVNFTMSSNISDSLLKDYDISPEKVYLVGAGSNIKLDPIMLEERNYGAKRIIFVGRDWKRKGGPILVSAFEKILDVHPDAQLVIIGCNPDINLKNVTVTGDISLNEVAKYYSQSSIFCLPTRIEPFGIVFLEAMMYSLPVVATNVGAIPDFIGEENGILVEPNNVEQIYESLLKLLNDISLCRSMGKQGFKKYQEKYTWEKVGLKMAASIKTELFKNGKSSDTLYNNKQTNSTQSKPKHLTGFINANFKDNTLL
jgi:glycosyltransferase involved in cell wall biosynthesis